MRFLKFAEEMNDYLCGSSFSSTCTAVMQPTGESVPLDRITLLERFAAGKNVIHVGCADHLTLIPERLARDVWLHGRLTRVARRCVGVDVDVEALHFLIEELRIPDVYCADILSDPVDWLADCHWDLLMLPEVLEHIDDPVRFLTTLKRRCEGQVDRIIITVPNAFRLQNFLFACRHREIVNSDHRYWFTPFTLAKVMTRAGFSVEQFAFVLPDPAAAENMRTAARRAFYRRFPALASRLVMTGLF